MVTCTIFNVDTSGKLATEANKNKPPARVGLIAVFTELLLFTCNQSPNPNGVSLHILPITLTLEDK